MQGTEAQLWQAYWQEASDDNRNAIFEFYLPAIEEWLRPAIRLYPSLRRHPHHGYYEALSRVTEVVIGRSIPNLPRGAESFNDNLHAVVWNVAMFTARDAHRDNNLPEVSHGLLESVQENERLLPRSRRRKTTLATSVSPGEFAEATEGLDEESRRLLFERYVEGYTLREMAGRRGVSDVTICHELKKSSLAFENLVKKT